MSPLFTGSGRNDHGPFRGDVHAKTRLAQAVKDSPTRFYGPSEHHRVADRRHVKWPDRSASVDRGSHGPEGGNP